MIKKPRKVPRIILKIEALLRRLDEKHQKRSFILEDYAKRMAGYKGELSLDYHLSILDKKKYLIFNDLRLLHNDYQFQLDTLILTPNYFLILEVKNIAGSVLFESQFDQFIRTLNGKEEGFHNPLHQIQKQEQKLKMWLAAHNITNLPIESLVVFINPQTIIKADSRYKALQKVTHSHNLIPKIERLEKIHQTNSITEKDLLKLTRHLLKKHTDDDTNILERYTIKEKEIQKGVQCTNCLYLPMIRNKGLWCCTKCGVSSRDAHISTLKDYSLLFGSTITHQRCKDFLRIDSKSITTKLLASLNLTYTGSTYKRVYRLNK